MYTRLSLLLPLLALACARTPSPVELGPARSGVRVRLTERFYDVRGGTAGEIERSKSDNGPLWNGERVSGLTTWNVRWRYDVRPGGLGCRLTNVEVVLELSIEMPRWTDSASAPDSLVAAWGEYVRALRIHEQGHAQLSLDAANRIHEQLTGLQTACALIREVANGDGNARLAELQRMSRRYDDESRRGGGQGAVWPPPGFDVRRDGAARAAAWISPTDTGSALTDSLAVFETLDSASGYRAVYLRGTADTVPRLIYEHRGSVSLRMSHRGDRVLINDRYDEHGMRVVLVDLSGDAPRELDDAVEDRFRRDVDLDPRLVVMPRAHAFSDDDARILISMRVVHVAVASTDAAIRLANTYEPRWYVVSVESGNVLEQHRGRREPAEW